MTEFWYEYIMFLISTIHDEQYALDVLTSIELGTMDDELMIACEAVREEIARPQTLTERYL